MNTNDDIRNHYSSGEPGDRAAKILAAVDALTPEQFEAANNAGFDQFHVRGLAATKELAKLAGIDASTVVLDAGAGLGGPSRYLAKTFGCRVFGVDLTPAFVEVARLFAERLGLGELVTYEIGDVAALPFSDDAFDVVWTQHVLMNVPDRERAYREFERVLRPGGTLAFYDVIASDDGARPYYPVPWADSNATSFLMTKSNTLAALERAGFTLESWNDLTETVVVWFGSVPTALPQGLSLAELFGPKFGAMTANFARNVTEARVRIAMGIGKVARP